MHYNLISGPPDGGGRFAPSARAFPDENARRAAQRRHQRFLKLAAQFDRREIAFAVDELIAMLDRADGDCDREDDDPGEDVGDEDDFGWTEWTGRAPRRKVTAGGYEGEGMTRAENDEDEEDDAPEDDGADLEHDGREPDYYLEGPVADGGALRHHLNRIRRTRCDRVRHGPFIYWRLRDAPGVTRVRF